MRIIKPQDFFPLIKNKTILLDTNVFIDASTNPTTFGGFLNELKENGATLVTLDVVTIEFIKGAQDHKRYLEKKNYVEQIIDTYLPLNDNLNKNALALVDKYHTYGKSVSGVDFLLGGALIAYSGNLLLMTRDTNDFSSDIFHLVACFNVVHPKGIFAYGLYEFKS